MTDVQDPSPEQPEGRQPEGALPASEPPAGREPEGALPAPEPPAGREPEEGGGLSPAVMLLLLAIVGAVIYTFVNGAGVGAGLDLPTGDDPDALIARARVLGEGGKLAEALPYMQRAVELAPESARAQAGLGSVLADLQRHGEAVTHLQKACALDPNKGAYALLLGRSLTAVERHDEARVALLRALEAAPEDPEPRYYLAVGAMRGGDWAEVAAQLEPFVAAAERWPRARQFMPLALRLLSDAQQATGDGEGAVATLHSLVAFARRDLGLRFAEGRLRMEVHGLDAALETAAAAASREDATLEDLCVQGHLLAFDPRPGANARAPLERAHALDPARPEPIIGLALEAARDGDLEQARTRLEGLLQRHPTYGGAKLLLAEVHRMAGRPAEARAIYEGLLGTPQGPHAERGILATHLAAEDAEAALGFVRGLFPEAGAGDPRHFLEADALEQLGRFEQARAVLERLREAGRPEDRTLWTYYAARLALDEGDLERARAAFAELDLPLRGEEAARFPRTNLWAGVALFEVDPERAEALWRAGAEDGARYGDRALWALACARLLGEATPEELAGAARIAEWPLRNDARVIEGLARELAGDRAGARDAYADALAITAGQEWPVRLAVRALERLAE